MKEKNLHDDLFKATFSIVSEVIAFSKIYLPKWLANQLDYETLKYEPYEPGAIGICPLFKFVICIVLKKQFFKL